MLNKVALLLASITAIASVGCINNTHSNLPYVQITTSESNVGPLELTSDMIIGAEIWEELGWRFHDIPDNLPECDEYWYEHQSEAGNSECTETINFELADDLDAHNAWAATYPRQRRTFINPKLLPSGTWNIERVIGHEVGHSLADSAFHPSSGDGIMIGTDFWLSVTDRQYMCDHAMVACDTDGVTDPRATP